MLSWVPLFINDNQIYKDSIGFLSMRSGDFFKLIRINQWYKNILIYTALIFSLNLFNLKYFILISGGFLSLCLISSSFYIINDIVDLSKDQKHPEKKERPITSGKISKNDGILISTILFFISLTIAYFLSLSFMALIFSLFLLSMLYTFYFKKFIFLDILFISINLVLRSVSGIFIINVPFSYWVVLCIFSVSVFLVGLKRVAELYIVDHSSCRPCYKKDHITILKLLSIVSLTCALLIFGVYCFLFKKINLILDIPIALYLCLSYLKTLKDSPRKVRNPKEFILEKKTILCLIIFLIITILSLYFFK